MIIYKAVDHIFPLRRPRVKLTGIMHRGIIHATERSDGWHDLQLAPNRWQANHLRYALAVRLLNNLLIDGVTHSVDHYTTLINVTLKDMLTSHPSPSHVNPLMDGLWTIVIDAALVEGILDPNPAVEVIRRETTPEYDIEETSVFNIRFDLPLPERQHKRRLLLVEDSSDDTSETAS